MRTELITIKATPEFKKRVKAAAEKDNKTLSSYIRDCILDDFKQKEKHGKDESLQ
jgi:predicted transcriptional regulator